nr:MAG TPA: hypothetical protein [Bacteriophage sp.]
MKNKKWIGGASQSLRGKRTNPRSNYFIAQIKITVN